MTMVQTLRASIAPPESRGSERLKAIFRVEERRGRRLMVIARSLALIAVAILILFIAEFPAVLYYHALILVFIAIGGVMWWMDLRQLYRPWHSYLFIVLDLVLMAITLLVPNPFVSEPWPAQFGFRFNNSVYFYMILVGLAFSYRPALVIWGGVVGTLVWTVGVVWIISLPNTVLLSAADNTIDQLMTFYADPTFVEIGARIQEIVVYAIVAGLLSLVVMRSRHLVVRQAKLERERSNLARYFPPETVNVLARNDTALSVEREQSVAVLFADIVGFSRFAEGKPPRDVIRVLREVHGILEAEVFDHGGTLDKFIGDGMMATFGTPHPTPDDARNAIACIDAVLAAMDAYNDKRAEGGEAPIRISLGVHYGPVVVGDIGSERRLELAVLGDTVNVASRLETMTRERGCRAIISDDVIRAVADADRKKSTERLEETGQVPIRGRDDGVRIWTR